jgi:hypothetical protein
MAAASVDEKRRTARNLNCRGERLEGERVGWWEEGGEELELQRREIRGREGGLVGGGRRGT